MTRLGRPSKRSAWPAKSSPEERYLWLKSRCRAYAQENHRLRRKVRVEAMSSASPSSLHLAWAREREALTDLVDMMGDHLAESGMLETAVELLVTKMAIRHLETPAI